MTQMGSRFPTIFLMVVLVPVGTAAQSSGTTHQAKNTHVRPDITWSSETQHADVYYVRAYRKGAYVIDHKGVRITAKCRNSLYWPNGLGTFGTPVKEHGCVYMHDLIGKSVGEDLMKQWNDTLVYSPYAGRETIQTADYLDITDEQPLAGAATEQAPVTSAITAASAALPIPVIAKKASDSVVSIIMSDKDGKPIGQGSGFFVSKDGLIVTNYHVIAEGSSAIVKLPDGAFYTVDGVLASDKTRDIAVVKAHGQNFRALTLGDSDGVQVGEEVVAIGSPLSLESTVSNGIVSGMRAVKEEGGDFLQITAPISPGSSGGPLFNMSGEVIGITTMYLKGGENLNFAIPINDTKPLLDLDSAKLKGFPDEPDSTTRQKQSHAEDSPSGPVAAPETPVTARDYYQQLFRAGGFSGNLPSYVCFSDDPHSATFFTFRAYGYDADYYNAQAKLPTFQEKMASGSDIVTPEEHKQFNVMEARQRTAPYVTFLMKGWLESFPSNVQQFFRSGGRLLEEDLFDKGVKTKTLEFLWDGSSWSLSVPPPDPKAYSRTSKVLRLSIEPTTMRYADSASVTMTVGWGDTAATGTDQYGPWAGVCEKVPNPNSIRAQASSPSTVAAPFPPLKSAAGAQNARVEVHPGLYQSDDAENDTRYYLRLYPDGTVIEVGTTRDATPDDIERWFHKPYPSSGTYQIQGSAIQFSIQSPEGMVDYQGQIQGTVLTLDSFSHINGHRGHATYHLVAVG